MRRKRHTLQCVVHICFHDACNSSGSGGRPGGAATEAIRRDRVKSSRVPLAALGSFFLSTLCNAEFS